MDAARRISAGYGDGDREAKRKAEVIVVQGKASLPPQAMHVFHLSCRAGMLAAYFGA